MEKAVRNEEPRQNHPLEKKLKHEYLPGQPPGVEDGTALTKLKKLWEWTTLRLSSVSAPKLKLHSWFRDDEARKAGCVWFLHSRIKSSCRMGSSRGDDRPVFPSDHLTAMEARRSGLHGTAGP